MKHNKGNNERKRPPPTRENFSDLTKAKPGAAFLKGGWTPLNLAPTFVNA